MIGFSWAARWVVATVSQSDADELSNGIAGDHKAVVAGGCLRCRALLFLAAACDQKAESGDSGGLHSPPVSFSSGVQGGVFVELIFSPDFPCHSIQCCECSCRVILISPHCQQTRRVWW